MTALSGKKHVNSQGVADVDRTFRPIPDGRARCPAPSVTELSDDAMLRQVDLMACALQADRSAGHYLAVARTYLTYARAAKNDRHELALREWLERMRSAHARARKCLAFATLCRRRAQRTD